MLLLSLLALSSVVSGDGSGKLASGVNIELSMEATCRGTEIELGEIATVRGADATLVARAKALEIGYAPSPGFSRVLRADRLRQILKNRLPGVAIEFSGHDRTRIAPLVTSIPADAIIEKARAELVSVFGSLEAEFRLNRPVQPVEVPAAKGGWRLHARAGSIHRPTSGVFTVPVEVYLDGTLYRTLWTNWSADVFETRQVLAQTVRAGERLTPDMFEEQRVRVTPHNDRAPLPIQLLNRAIANRNLGPGESVKDQDVYRHHVIQSGARVQLLVKSGRVRATVAAEALYSGAIGERIRVKNMLTEEHLTAVIRSRDLVEIDITR